MHLCSHSQRTTVIAALLPFLLTLCACTATQSAHSPTFSPPPSTAMLVRTPVTGRDAVALLPTDTPRPTIVHTPTSLPSPTPTPAPPSTTPLPATPTAPPPTAHPPPPTPAQATNALLSTTERELDGLQLSPDSRYAVYQSTRSIFSVALADGTTTRLATDVRLLEIDTHTISYAGEHGLARMPLTGGAVVVLAGPEVSPAHPDWLTLDGQAVIGCTGTEDMRTLSLHPLDGGSPTTRFQQPMLDCLAALAPDGSFLLVLVTKADPNWPHTPSWPFGVRRIALYRVPVNGGEPVLLTAPLGPTEEIWSYELSPDGRTVVYQAGGTLYRVPAVSGAVEPLGSSINSAVAFSPTDGSLIFAGLEGLYQVPEGGGARLLVPAQVPNDRPAFDFTPDGQYLVYQDRRQAPGPRALAYLPLAGGTPITLTESLVENFLSESGDYLLAPDGRQLLFLVEHQDGTYSLIRATLGTPAVVELGRYRPGEIPDRCQVSPDSQYAVCIAEGALVAMPLSGRPARQLSPPGMWASAFAISADSSQVVYYGSLLGHDPTGELRVARLDGGVP